MAKIRTLDLAKKLNVEVSELQSVAGNCGVVVSGPTSMLTVEDREKISEALRQGGLKTGGRGHTVQVEVRRTARRAATGASPQSSGVASKSVESPAQRAAKAVKAKQESHAPGG